MEKIRRLWTFVFLSLTFVACESAEPTELPDGYVRASVEAAKLDLRYSGGDLPDTQTWGPSGIFKVRHGFVVADNVGRKLMRFGDDLAPNGSLPLPAGLRAANAVVQDGEDLVALDAADVVPRIARIAADGSARFTDVPKESSLSPAPTGILMDDRGMVLDYGFGEKLFVMNDAGERMAMSAADGYVWEGTRFSVDPPAGTAVHERTVRVGDKAVIVSVPNRLGAVQFIGPDGHGGAFALVEDVRFVPEVAVEQSLWDFSAGGEIVSVAKVPLEQRGSVVEHGVAVDRNGDALALVPRSTSLEFWGLTNVNARSILLRTKSPLVIGGTKSGGLDVVGLQQGLIGYSGSCLTTAQFQSNANEYLNNSTYIGSASIAGTSCGSSAANRTAPHYLTGAGTWPAVSYAWGRSDSPTSFNAAMASGLAAGNMNDAYNLSCTYGVDCSGFLARVWGYSSHVFSTTDLGNGLYVKPYTPATMYFGDVFNWKGHHVVIFNGYISNGINTVESTALNSYDRVVSTSRTWAMLSGYQALRSVTSCM